MEQINTVNINELTDVRGLCRVCLTESKKMTPLDYKIAPTCGEDISTILHLLHRVTGVEVPNDKRYPSYICPMCLSLLKMAHKFKLQFETSQKLLGEYFGECLPIGQSLASVIEIIQEDELKTAPVELIIPKQGKYDLKDVFVIENEQSEKPNYTGFLKNLGKEVSASFVNGKVTKFKTEDSVNDNPSISLITLNEICQSNLKMEVDGMKLELNDGIKCNITQFDDVNEDVAAVNNGYFQQHSDVTDDMDESDKKVNRKIMRCAMCEKVFANKKCVRLHVERVHLHMRQTFICERCGVVLKSRSSHYHHMLKHYGKRHKCCFCHKTYLSASTLQQHITAVHKNARLHLCTICGKSFNYRNALDYHMRIHTNERKYRCSYCDKTFRMQCGLNRHVRIHTGIRPYKCTYCDKAFRSKGELDCHEMIHTGFRPYHCKYCQKGFTKTYNLKMHMLGHPGRHACEICNKTFIELEFLKVHMRISHAIKEEDSDKESKFGLTFHT